MDVNMREVVNDLCSELETITPCYDDFISSRKEVSSVKGIVSSIVEEKTEINTKVTELHSKLDEVDRDIRTKSQQIESDRILNNSLKNELQLINKKHHEWMTKYNSLTNKKFNLKNHRVPSNCKLSSTDQALFNDRRLRTSLFKNLLGLKFTLFELNKVVEGYVFNKNYVKWFLYRLNKVSKQEIVKLLWKEIKKSGEVSKWPVPSIKDEMETSD